MLHFVQKVLSVLLSYIATIGVREGERELTARMSITQKMINRRSLEIACDIFFSSASYIHTECKQNWIISWPERLHYKVPGCSMLTVATCVFPCLYHWRGKTGAVNTILSLAVSNQICKRLSPAVRRAVRTTFLFRRA